VRADEKLTAFVELESVATTRARTFTGLSRIILKFNELRSNRQNGPGILISSILMPEPTQDFSNLSGDFRNPETANLGEE
jgi:hypothetical protein